MNEKHKRECRALNYFEHFLIFNSAISGYILISAFVSLVDVLVAPVGIIRSAVGINICAITAGVKKYKSVIKKKRKKQDKMVLLAKAKLNATKVLNYKGLIHSCINHDEFVSVNNVLREYNEMKEEIKNPENAVEYIVYKNNGTALLQL